MHIETLKYYIQSANINFLYGSGLSRPYLTTLGNIEKCPYRGKVDRDYDCKTAVWEVVQGEKQAKCPYAVALHSMGLWQNKLVVPVGEE